MTGKKFNNLIYKFYAFKQSLIVIIYLFVPQCELFFFFPCQWAVTARGGTSQAIHYNLQLLVASLEFEMEKRPLGKLRSTQPSPPD